MATVIIGSLGQVGSALLNSTQNAIGLSRSSVDLSDPENLIGAWTNVLQSRLGSELPTVVINAAAYTQVDRAEQEEALAFRINAISPGLLAKWCSERGIPFVHYSTDYVFPGDGNQPWTEESLVRPLSAYGRTKLAGEQAVMAAGGKPFIFRTSWVYDAQGKNFLKTMLRLGIQREELSVVADQFGAPTYAPHLAQVTLEILENVLQEVPEKVSESLEKGKSRGVHFPGGIYHLCHQGETTWHGFAEQIFESARRQGILLQVKNVKAIETSAYPTPAKRPLNSRLSTFKAKEVLGVTLPDWRVGLKDCMADIADSGRGAII